MFVPTMVSGQQPSSGPTAGPAMDVQPGATTAAAAIAVNLGSGGPQVWVAGRGIKSCSTTDTVGTSRSPVRRGRVADGSGCIDMLSQLIRQYRDPIPAAPVVVVCRPVLATAAEQHVVRQVVATVFAPSRVLFIDTVRAAAIGAGAAAGSLLIADIGAEVSEVAALEHGTVRGARRTDIGTRDLKRGAPTELLARTTARMISELSHDAASRALVSTALTRGLVVVGDGAAKPGLTVQIAARLRTPVQSAAAPWTVALHGAGLAAMSAAHHPGVP